MRPGCSLGRFLVGCMECLASEAVADSLEGRSGVPGESVPIVFRGRSWGRQKVLRVGRSVHAALLFRQGKAEKESKNKTDGSVLVFVVVR